MQQPVNLIHLLGGSTSQQRRQIILVQFRAHSPKLSIGCLERTSFAAGSGAWTWKIAYDEEWSRFSPGAQLMLDVVKAIFSDETITAIDSCATADHPLIDHIWSGRLAIGTIVIGPPEGSAVHTVGLAAARAELAARAAVRRFV